jgi:integrase
MGADEQWIRQRIGQINQCLSDMRSLAKLRRRGGRLELRATLPPKPNNPRVRPYQQEISLGVPCNEDGFKRAFKEAKILNALLIAGEFKWERYLNPSEQPQTQTIGDLVAAFEQHYRARHKIQQRTWNNDWLMVFRQLPQDEPISIEALSTLAESKAPDTAIRRKVCEKLQHLANFANLPIDLGPLKGHYGPNATKARVIPSDAEIAEYRDRVAPDYRWIYSIIAAYGLRPYEAFFCEFRSDGLFVPAGKTGQSRIIPKPFYPEWETAWGLRDRHLPPINYQHKYSRGKLGSYLAGQFARMSIPFTPYALRHAFALRISVAKWQLPIKTASMIMGHTPDVHWKIYNRWINEGENARVVIEAATASDRPLPPGET